MGCLGGGERVNPIRSHFSLAARCGSGEFGRTAGLGPLLIDTLGGETALAGPP